MSDAACADRDYQCTSVFVSIANMFGFCWYDARTKVFISNCVWISFILGLSTRGVAAHLENSGNLTVSREMSGKWQKSSSIIVFLRIVCYFMLKHIGQKRRIFNFYSYKWCVVHSSTAEFSVRGIASQNVPQNHTIAKQNRLCIANQLCSMRKQLKQMLNKPRSKGLWIKHW